MVNFQTRNPHAVQPHLRKCFDAIAQLGFANKLVLPDGSERLLDGNEPTAPGAKIVMSTDISTMVSPEGETIKLPKVFFLTFLHKVLFTVPIHMYGRFCCK